MTEWLDRNRLEDAIHMLHGNDNVPATYHRGSKQIDGIFVSSTINPICSGFLEFGGFPSDHRCLWMDISFNNAFGYKMQYIANPQARRLKCDDPRIRKKWTQAMHKFVREHNLYKRIKRIEDNMNIPLSPESIREFSSILALRKQGMDHADKVCRHLKMGQVPYSPEIKRMALKLTLWKAVKTKKLGCKYSQSKLRRLEKQTGISNSLHTPLHIVEMKIRSAQMEYNKVKKEAKELRYKFLEAKAAAMAEENNGDQKNVYKQLILREKQREAARKIKTILHKINGGGVTRIEIQANNGDITEITTKEGIERACMEENKAKNSQTRNTPCMTDPLRSAIGYNSNSSNIEAILDGTFVVPNEAPAFAQEFFNQFQRAEVHAPLAKNHLDRHTFCTGWKKMKEKTSSGISGLHFGHMKACAQDKLLSRFETTLGNIPFSTGYSPPEWRTGVSVMIHKKANLDLVTKLRTITLLEADFNFNNKVLGKMTMDHAEKNNLLAKEQYRSRSGKKAIDHAVHKRLTYDIIRQLRIPAALCSNDAKSCFDRMVHSIVNILCRPDRHDHLS